MKKSMPMQDLTMNSYLSGGNDDYLENLYETYLKRSDKSVATQWRIILISLPNDKVAAKMFLIEVLQEFCELAQQTQDWRSMSSGSMSITKQEVSML